MPVDLRAPWSRRTLTWLCLGVLLGCSGSDGAGLEVPSLRVRTSTTGVELDPNGYSVSVDGAPGRLIETNGSVEIGSLDDGTHEAALLDVAPNCSVIGAQPALVTTTSGSTTDLRLTVECSPSLGAVRVITRTDGTDQDEDGYVVVVAGEARQIGIDESLTFESVPAGPTITEVLGVASNCVAVTQTYYEITVTGGSTTDVTFAFDCSPRQPDTGTLQVATATSGVSPDADGYLVTIDGGDSSPIGASDTELLTGLAIGSRNVALSGVAANCQVSGANPRSVTVSGTDLAEVAFAVVCSPPASSTGTLRLTTTSSGTDLDPTGYTVRIDGGNSQPIGANESVSIGGVPTGSRSILLDDLAANCIVTDNPRNVLITAGQQAELSFQVVCGPAFGTIATTAVTTGTAIDSDGYVARVNGGAGKPIPPNGTVTRGGLTPGSHTVQLDNVAPNCLVHGDNPRAVLVAGNETTPVTFEVVCVATTGSLTIAVGGLPAGVVAQIEITGPGGFEQAVTATTTVIDLTPGVYIVAADPVQVGADVYHPGSARQEVGVASGQSLTAAVDYSLDPGGDGNLRIAGMYITQGSQTADGLVPLIEGRDGYLRVFVLANGDNVGRPAVRVRIFQGATQVQTAQIESPPGAPPTVLQEEPLTSSWNLGIPGHLIRPGLRILADVDPDGRVAESDEFDNTYPLDGTPGPLVVRTVPTFAVRLVPIQLGFGELTGDLSPSNVDRYLDVSLNLHPLPAIDAALHAVFTSSLSPSQAGGVNEALYNALSELRLLRAIEGDTRSYYGVTHRNYSSGGIAGLGYIGHPAALGWDDPADAGWTAAHEFGHNWNRRHTPCGGPANTDPGYPYVGGTIGVYGFDRMAERLIPPHDSGPHVILPTTLGERLHL